MIRNRHTFTVALACLLAASVCGAQTRQTLRLALIHDNAVCTIVDASGPRCFAAGTVRARLPVWSRDGTRVAYIEDTHAADGLATLVVVDQFGQVQVRAAIKPVANGEVRSGMRYVESVEWISPDQVVVSGSVNPSTTEHLVVDLLRGAVTNEYIVDAHGAVFSPDGKHVAVIGGAPHFTNLSSRAPVLSVDDQDVLKDLNADLSYVGRPKWSADSRALAVSLRDASGRARIAHWSLQGGAVRLVDLPFAVGAREDGSPTVFWSGGDLHVQRMVTSSKPNAGTAVQVAGPGAKAMSIQDWVLRVDRLSATWKLTSTPALDPAKAAAVLRAQALETPLPAGARDVDVWCSACALDSVDRRSGAASD